MPGRRGSGISTLGRIAACARGGGWLLAAAALWLGCGGKVTVDDEDATSGGASGSSGGDLPATPEELCERTGGQWELEVLDCGGAEDACDLGACLSVIGTGCICPGDACWDRTLGTCRAA